MSIVVNYASTMTVLETLTVGVPDVPNPVITHSSFNTSGQFIGSSTPPASKVADFQQALSGGVATINLTALTGTNGIAVDFTGLKVQFVKFINPSTNANAITVTFGASNAYLLHGAAFKYILQPGEEVMFKGLSTTPTVSASLKNIDISGTGTQALNVQLIAG